MGVQSKILTHLGPREVGERELKDVRNYATLDQLGINLPEAKLKELAMICGMDSLQAGLTTPSLAVPIQFLQSWLPGLVRITTAKRAIDDILGIQTAGRWHDEEVVQTVVETTGSAKAYGDYTNVPLTSWTPAFARRTIIRGEQGMQVGVLEEARSAEIRVSTAAMKRDSAALALEIFRNAVGFKGFNSGDNRTYGLLNDPNLPAYVTVPVGAASTTTWATKTFLEITKDIRTWLTGLQVQSKGVVDPRSTPITMALALSAVNYLSVTSDFGVSVQDWLTKTYPNVRVVSAPELDAASGGSNVAYVYAETVDDGLSSDDRRTFAQIVPSKFMMVGIEKRAKGYIEDFSNALAGVLCKRPFAVYRAKGI